MINYKHKYLKYKHKYLKINLQNGGSLENLVYLHDKNPEKIPERGDGACLFRALSRFLHGVPEKHTTVRAEICLYLLNNSGEWIHALPDTLPDNDYYKYIEKMLDRSVYGDNVEIVGFVNLYGCTIVIHYSKLDKDNKQQKPYTIEPNKIDNINLDNEYIYNGSRLLENKILHLLYNGGHYDTLKFDNSDNIKYFS